MSDDQTVLMLEELVHVRKELSQFQSSVAVLRIAVSALISPEDPAKGMKDIEAAEKIANDSAEDQKEFLSRLDQIEVLKILLRRGSVSSV